ncbi:MULTISPECIES: hypothetical protein [unclassified Mesorhizobium]|uniref:hypothetical protein n=1 Tax=unclassified Mesorhizobium TaxID=325217 RepID=UPI0030142A2A
MSDINDQMNAEQERAFLEWRDLRNKAEATGDMTDANAAGKAFATFFYTYVANTYRPSPSTGHRP